MEKLIKPVRDFHLEAQFRERQEALELGLLVADGRGARVKRHGATMIVSDGTTDGAPDSCCAVIETDEPANFSSGILVAGRAVLTAKHSAPPGASVRIPAKHYLDGTPLRATKVVRNGEADLALLLLETEVSGVRPAKLAGPEDFEIAIQQGILFCGFGYTRINGGPPTAGGIKRISQNAVPILSTSLPNESGVNFEKEFIAGGIGPSGIYDAETGDSGGPGYLPNNLEVVVGIVSRNAYGHRSVLTRVDRFAGWIRSAAAEGGVAIP